MVGRLLSQERCDGLKAQTPHVPSVKVAQEGVDESVHHLGTEASVEKGSDRLVRLDVGPADQWFHRGPGQAAGGHHPGAHHRHQAGRAGGPHPGR